jgi:cytochrome c
MRALAGAAFVLPALVASAPGAAQGGDAARGAALYESRCGACHSVAADRIGPRHAGVLGRKAGGVDGYDYSTALKASRLVWDRGALERWLTDPEAVIPGQRMGYRLGDAGERADIVAYLVTLK